MPFQNPNTRPQRLLTAPSSAPCSSPGRGVGGRSSNLPASHTCPGMCLPGELQVLAAPQHCLPPVSAYPPLLKGPGSMRPGDGGLGVTMATIAYLWHHGIRGKMAPSPQDWTVWAPLCDLAFPVKTHLSISGPHSSAHSRPFLEHWWLPWKWLWKQTSPCGLRKNP